jgi:hypothetical protein
MYWKRFAICPLFMAMTACGSNSNPAGATTGIGGSGGSGTTTNRTLTVTIDNVAFSPTIVSAVKAAPNGTTPQLVILSASNGVTTFAFGALAQVGVQTIAAANPVNANMTIVNGAVATGYLAFATQGSGSVTISSLTTMAVSGRVDLVLVPTSGGGAAKTVSGTFNVAF